MAAAPSPTRRQWLAAAAVLAAAGCARPPVPGAATLTIGDSGSVYHSPGLQRAFDRSHPGIHIREVGMAGPAQGIPVALIAVFTDLALGLRPYRLVALDAPLRAANFNPGVLLPGALQAFVSQGRTMAVPVWQEPLSVLWRKDVFAAAGLPAPTDQWTLGDFEAVCTELAAFVASGRLPGLAGVLPPLLSFQLQPFQQSPPNTSVLGDPWRWMAFVLGFGGTAVSDGRFAFDARALEGMAAYVDLVRRFAPLPAGATPRNGSDFVAPVNAYALAFQNWVPPANRLAVSPSPLFEFFDSAWAYARLPRFPARPVITTNLLGMGAGTAIGRAAAHPTPAELDAAGIALAWLLGRTAQSLLRAAGHVPVVAEAGAQKAFWDQFPAADQAVGDWRNFAPWSTGWPLIPPQTPMDTALLGAIAEPGQLAGLLQTACQQMNARLPGMAGG